MFWKTKKADLGIDLGDFAVKLCHLQPSSNSCVVSQRELLPKRDDKDTDAPNATLDRVVGEAIREVSIQLKEKAVKVKLSVQDYGLATGYLELPDLDARELEVALPSGVAKLIPHELAEVTLFSLRVPPLGQSNMIGLFFMATPKEGLARLRTRIGALGCEVIQCEPSVLSLVRGLTSNRERGAEENWAAICCGFRTTTVVMFRGPHPYYSRSFRIAGGDFTHVMQMARGSTWGEAEQFKKENGAENAHLNPVVLRWTAEVKRSLEYGARQCPGLKPESLLLTGGSALWPNLAQRLSSYCNLPVERQQWSKVRPSSAGHESETVYYDQALGLASMDR